jgi:UDP-N-acetylglucosamine--N-acetylmuramyl-(pentapeptide) pyrophosphoryl-undecaprenol N-acetylglucosamine transferase
VGQRAVHLVASGGGHLDLLRRVAGVFDGHPRIWLTTPGRGAEQLRAAGERVLELPPLDRRNRSPANLTRSLALLARERPRLVVTSGAGLVATFCTGARLAGARVLFAETMARVTDASLSGRVLSRVAHETLVQWEEMRAVYRGAVVCRPALLDGLEPAPPPEGEGTFVTLGTHHQRFDRLLRMVDEAAAAGILPRPVFGQVGASAGFASALADSQLRPWLAPEEMRARLRGAAVVVTHGGAGVIASSLREGRRPLVLARLGTLGEHVDDHQRQVTAKLAELGVAVALGDAIRPEHVAAARAPVVLPAWPAAMPSVGEALAAAAAPGL